MNFTFYQQPPGALRLGSIGWRTRMSERKSLVDYKRWGARKRKGGGGILWECEKDAEISKLRINNRVSVKCTCRDNRVSCRCQEGDEVIGRGRVFSSLSATLCWLSHSSRIPGGPALALWAHSGEPPTGHQMWQPLRVSCRLQGIQDRWRLATPRAWRQTARCVRITVKHHHVRDVCAKRERMYTNI